MAKEFPSRNNLKILIDRLKEVDYEKLSYNKVCSILLNEIKLLPIHERSIKPKTSIFRGRINFGIMFTSESEISYNPDPFSIKKYGRFNTPHQSFFYGSLRLDKNEKINNTIIGELQQTVINNSGYYMMLITIGRWEVLEEFKIISTLFEEADLNNEFANHPENREETILIVNFFADQIKKQNESHNHNNYKLTAAYANYLLTQKKECHGILYHSVNNVAFGRNILLKPSAVDIFMELREVKLFMVNFKDGNILKVLEIMNVKDFGFLNSSFKWKFNNDF